uniref:Leucine rich repeat containing 20 n=1 Tax=Leptobrachium leishanense TaxID=445787 RepID=A0A8C5Q414_9ANUR
MAAAAAKVAKKVNDVVENRETHLDLSSCGLNAFPIGVLVTLSSVIQDIKSIKLANNEIKSLTPKFFTAFSNLQDLDLQGNVLKELPDVSSVLLLKSINLSKNNFKDFPTKLLEVPSIECINLADNQLEVETTSLPYLPPVAIYLYYSKAGWHVDCQASSVESRKPADKYFYDVSNSSHLQQKKCQFYPCISTCILKTHEKYSF